MLAEGLSIDLSTREVGAEVVALTAKEFDRLTFMALGTVTEHIRRLRKRIELVANHPRWITTAWAMGYRFNP